MTPQEKQAFWEQHVQAWRPTKLSQRTYCQQNDLPLIRFTGPLALAVYQFAKTNAIVKDLSRMNKRLVYAVLIVFAVSGYYGWASYGSESVPAAVVTSGNEGSRAVSLNSGAERSVIAPDAKAFITVDGAQAGPPSSTEGGGKDVGNDKKDFDIPDHVRLQMEKDLADGSEARIAAGMRAGFGKDAAEKMANRGPNRTLNTDDLPAAIAGSVRLKAEQFKKNGFQDADPPEADEILNINNYIEGDSVPIERLSFSESALPDEIIENYSYVGHSFPGAGQSKSNSNDTVRRVFRYMGSGPILIIEEQTLNHGNAALLSDFVNTKVSEYPAILSTKKAGPNESYETLNWVTRNSAYMIYAVGDDTDKEYLISLAEELTRLNDRDPPSPTVHSNGGRTKPGPTDGPPAPSPMETSSSH